MGDRDRDRPRRVTDSFRPREDRRNESSSRRTTLFVGGISSRTRARDLAYEFERYGRLVRCDIPAPRSYSSKPYAFVEFEDYRDADDAFVQMQNRRVDGYNLTIQWAKNAPSRSWRYDGDDGDKPRDKRRSRSPRGGSGRKRSRSPKRSKSPREEKSGRDRSNERKSESPDKEKRQDSPRKSESGGGEERNGRDRSGSPARRREQSGSRSPSPQNRRSRSRSGSP